jgi:hypothetical protein
VSTTRGVADGAVTYIYAFEIGNRTQQLSAMPVTPIFSRFWSVRSHTRRRFWHSVGDRSKSVINRDGSSPRDGLSAWAEAVTRLENQEVPDALYDAVSQKFSDVELAQLTLAIVAINGWNRFNVAFHTPAGHYKSNIKQAAA